MHAHKKPFLEIGIEGIVKQLKNLNQNKATGPDELPARVLKENAAEIAPINTHLFSSHTILPSFQMTGSRH